MVRQRETLLRPFVWRLCAVLVLLSASSTAHPHDEPEIFDVKGTVARVDLVNRIIEVNAFDGRTKTTRNMLFFVDQKIRIRNGKARVELADLRPGQRVTCTIERQHQAGRDDRERLTVVEIRLDVRS